MTKGLPAAIIKKYGVTKKAWQVYKGKGKRNVYKSQKQSNPKRRKRRTMARRKTTRKTSKSLVRSVEKIMKTATFLGPGLVVGFKQGTAEGKANAIFELYSGVNIKESVDTGKFSWHWDKLIAGWGPYIAFNLMSALAHKANGLIRRV